jgi:rare lipoprotein A
MGVHAMRTIILTTLMALLTIPGWADNQQGQTQRGQASYYKGGQSGHSQTKSGEPVNPNENQAASRNLPLGSTATVTNHKTGQSTDVKIKDRGPTREDRVIDMSEKSASDIGMKKSGTAPVTVEPKK